MGEPRLLAQQADESRLVRRAWPLTRGSRLLLALTGLVNLLGAAATVASFVALGAAVDAVVDRDRSHLVLVGIWFAMAVVAAFALTWVGEWLVVATGETFVRRLRDDTVARLASAPVRFVEAHRAGDLVRRVSGELSQLSQFVGGSLPDVVTSVFTLAMTVAVLAGYSWVLTVVLVVLLLAVSWPIVHRYLAAAGPAYAAAAAAEARVCATLAESLPAREQLMVLGARDRRVAALERDSKGLLRAGLRVVRVDRILAALGPAHGIVLVILVVLCALATGAGWIGVAAAVVFLTATRHAFADIEGVAVGIGDLQAARTGLARVLDLRDACVTGADPGHTGDAPDQLPGRAELVATDLSFAYRPDRPGLQDVSLTIAAGEHVTVVGPSGSGKTTLGKLLAGLYLPDAGEIRYAGIPLTSLTETQVRTRVALLTQDVLLIDGSIAANLALAPGVGDGPDGRQRMHRVAESLGLGQWLSDLSDGLDTPVGPRGSALSAGERQLVCLVRAMLTEPAVLILDEATAVIDPALAARVEQALVLAGRSRSVITIAHRPDTIDRARRVVRLEDGRLVEDNARAGSRG